MRKTIIGIIIGIVVGATTCVIASNLIASNITYTPKDSSWGVNNVEAAIDSLYISKTSNNYSTEEKVVGTWIDGKSLYQKTIRLANQNATTFTYAHGISNIDYVSIVPAASCVDSHSYSDIKQGLPYYISSTDWIFIRVIGANLPINKGSASNWYVNNADLIVTLQYTKTTDSAS